MATTRMIPMHKIKNQSIAYTVHKRINYAINPAKTLGSELVMTYGCDPATAANEMLLTKRAYADFTGREIPDSDVLLYQIRQSFKPGEITPEQQIGYELAMSWTKGKHQFVVATHIDHAHIHNHIIWNAVNLDCDRKFRNFWGSTRAVRRLNDTICIENGYSIVEHPKPRGKSYDKWLGDQAKPSHRELLRVAIDNALSQKPADWDALLKLLQKAGYEIKPGQNPSFRCEGWGRPARLDTLGENYSKDVLLSVLKGEKRHTPRKKKQASREPEKVNLLVDIQKKLQEGKGAGYARWARSFNLKQLAQTMNFLTDHNLLEYAALSDKTADATARYNALSDQIKAAEKRMAEIAVLKTHIINYSKTRDVYVAYRKAGYSKKFLAEHEADILLHKAAKKAFDELGLKKIPTVKSLQAEYAKLLEEKKKAYGEYRQARDEMRELLAVKANVDQPLGTGEQEAEKEKEHGQR